MARGVTGNFQSNPRVFAHDAVSLVTNPAAGGTFVKNYTFGDPIPGTESEFSNGVCLYIGKDIAQLDVVMESGEICVFNNVKEGMFLPILVKAVRSAGGILNAGELVALY